MLEEQQKQKSIDAWFNENEQMLIAKAREKHRKEKEDRERQELEAKSKELRDLHWMKCPKCGQDMKSLEIESIEVDQCTGCEGIYFDAGELDELLLKKAEERKSFFRRIVRF